MWNLGWRPSRRPTSVRADNRSRLIDKRSLRWPVLVDFDSTPDRLEITVDAYDQIDVNGWAQLEVLHELLESMGRPG